jgi:hypothetical protein
VFGEPAVDQALRGQSASGVYRGDGDLDCVDGGAVAHVGRSAGVEDVDVCVPGFVPGPASFGRVGDAAGEGVRDGDEQSEAAGGVGDGCPVAFGECECAGVVGMEGDAGGADAAGDLGVVGEAVVE